MNRLESVLTRLLVVVDYWHRLAYDYWMFKWQRNGLFENQCKYYLFAFCVCENLQQNEMLSQC